MNRKIVLSLMVLVLGFASIAEARGRRSRNYFGNSSTSASVNAVVDQSPTYEVEVQLLKEVNIERERYGLVPLVLDRVIQLRARRHCGWMANSGSMIHSNDGAENIAMGQTDVKEVMHAWMGSSGHRANILNPGWRKIGLIGYRSPSGTTFWCQQFE
jgi:uncharacterized protein YkwD